MVERGDCVVDVYAMQRATPVRARPWRLSALSVCHSNSF
jgi:hypothetical protein